MTKPIHLAAAAERLWSTAAGDAGHLASQIPERIAVPPTPEYALARRIPLPAGHPFDTGALSARIDGIVLDRARALDAARSSHRTGPDRVTLTAVLPSIGLRGRYFISARRDPRSPLDSGGDLMPRFQSAVGGAEGYVDQARDQRTRLMQTANGQALVSTYNEHNERYEEAFQYDSALQTAWVASGATAQMASETSAAVAADNAVNPSSHVPNGATYNGNTFAQQINVAVSTMLRDPSFDPFGGAPPDPASPYTKAALAALSFGKAVGATGNTKSQVVEMKPSQVLTSVDNHTGALPTTTVAELAAIIGQGQSPAMRAMRAVPAEPSGPTIELDDDDRARIRWLVDNAMRARADARAQHPVEIFTGSVEAQLTDARVVAEVSVTPQGIRLISASTELAPFALDLDDSLWTGPAGVIARRRLAGASFIRSLVRDAVAHRLAAAVGAAAVNALGAAVGSGV